jgi:predicted nucleic acid-binding protein
MKYALDTNIISIYGKGNQNVIDKFDAAVKRGDEIIIPPLVHYEIKRGLLCKSFPKFENFYRVFTENCLIGEMGADVLERGAVIYAQLYSAKRTVDDVDLLIAAFCIVGGYTLITNNIRHFQNITSLTLEDWTKK